MRSSAALANASASHAGTSVVRPATHQPAAAPSVWYLVPHGWGNTPSKPVGPWGQALILLRLIGHTHQLLALRIYRGMCVGDGLTNVLVSPVLYRADTQCWSCDGARPRSSLATPVTDKRGNVRAGVAMAARGLVLGIRGSCAGSTACSRGRASPNPWGCARSRMQDTLSNLGRWAFGN